MTDIALELIGVGVTIDGHRVLTAVDWTVSSGQRWVVLGANGAGKTTLLRVASLHQHPSVGEVTVLGEALGHTDVRRLRIRIGLVSAAVNALLRPGTTAIDAVCSARYGALVPWWIDSTDEDRRAGEALLDRFGIGDLADRALGTLSTGERQRVQLARALVTDPGLLLLDEPTAGLDLGARERLITDLERLAEDADTPPAVLVTHHVEEIPRGFTHALLLRDGEVSASGPIERVLTDRHLSACFQLDLRVDRTGGRWQARAR